jgi:MFS transporter, LPLT family, lysophospholipid transporter
MSTLREDAMATAAASPGPRAMVAVLVAQFLSALGDNALLFAALAVLQRDQYPVWSVPVLQEFFVGSYIVLAPFAGPLADSLPKGRVMLLANGLKLGGTLAMALGANPFLAYGLVGIGAAAYSPAKYGILSELATPAGLVKANGLMESSTIAAILVGAIAGGMLADRGIVPALGAVLGCYALAALANLLVPRLPAARPTGRASLRVIWRDFGHALRTLRADRDARFSIVGTSLFWGTGATLRFLLLAWVPVALGVAGSTLPSYLNGMVAIGIVGGAALAARTVRLADIERALPAGIALGLLVCAMAWTHQLGVALVVMVLLGACGGYFVVPLNALLQERGHASVGAGHAIAVQNLAENGAMLLMIGAYSLSVRAHAPVAAIAAGLGLVLAAAISALLLLRRRGH